jgi:hypothetical protein
VITLSDFYCNHFVGYYSSNGIDRIPVKEKITFTVESYQPHASEDRDAVDALDGEIDETGDNDDQVEDVPTARKVFFAHGQKF